MASLAIRLVDFDDLLALVVRNRLNAAPKFPVLSTPIATTRPNERSQTCNSL
jgi:hypothetical protein